MNAEVIKQNVFTGNYRYRIHALERMAERKISPTEIEEAISNGEIIEDYPDDKYGQSCLILGYTNLKRPLHIQCSIKPTWIITCYDPSLRKEEWSEDYKTRRK